ncbi:YchJ family metal-binding protein [Thaumasiovibrio sp. DFM-14]|uniref:YchJ family metal-binding protein n=1 Tax=Thaumasiovibrio sp. DFM-14 TaxID=3384792 RepID=UPI00399F8F5E
MTLCPCGSGLDYSACCQPIIQNPRKAECPEQLMRSRYTAHVVNNANYVVSTYHPSCHAEQFADAIADSVASQWVALQIIEAPTAESNEGFVHFVATYIENNQLHFLEEHSRFLKEADQWFYVDGQYPAQPRQSMAIGRNDPCPCLSGKKYKKCCAK